MRWEMWLPLRRKTTQGNTGIRIDYRVLQPYWVTDPNGNRTRVAFDTLGMVVGTAVMGKPLPAPVEGDSLEAFEAELTEAIVLRSPEESTLRSARHPAAR